MSQLHILGTLSPNAIDDMLPMINADDTLLLIDDAAYTAITGSSSQQRLDNIPCHVIALEEACVTRGITSPSFTTISMPEFVALSLDARHVLNWF
ncbi:Protein TusB [BD1-7 clade bacterium]|uniref:Protein TusB n=1 Tax=BD1-7 clade bacterium TaxID=2029982 RepID=A0A5S9P0K0_9GAMM|nr:Protein TusB [BD1-7 clade bacterium]CAA0115907.1 Protein TusB [BD1-7 clade bacterium]CAA0119579.1 Protein TusB [BD1-7 clade bacterium]